MVQRQRRLPITVMSGYATYRLPDTDEIITIRGKVDVINNLSDIKEQQGYLVAPFDVLHHPILLIRKESVTRSTLPDIVKIESSNYPTLSQTPYEPAFHLFHEAVRTGQFHKLVLSRAIVISRGKRKETDIFQQACHDYPHQMVTLFSTPQSGTWLVITPEILFTATSDGQCSTMALAGTMPADTTSQWSTKNRQEQQVVADYIQNQLTPLVCQCSIHGPYTTVAGRVQHLRTDFSFRLNDSRTIGDILATLHPTPAVCGMPKDQALHFICANEGYDREYYSGFSGPLNIDSSTNIYVTLRCAKIPPEHITLYAGGGIMPESELTSEELETRLKMGTVQSVI